MKAYVIKIFGGLLEGGPEVDLDREIQRVHRDPFRLKEGRKRPRKILVSFLSFSVKERILGLALKDNTRTHFQIRSDICRTTEQRRWEMGQRMTAIKELGANVQLRFPAFLKVVRDNHTYVFRELGEVDEFILDTQKAQKSHKSVPVCVM